MKLKIKEEYLDCGIYCPLRKVEVPLRFQPEDLLEFYFKKGYSHLFEVEEEPTEIKKIKTNKFYDLPE